MSICYGLLSPLEKQNYDRTGKEETSEVVHVPAHPSHWAAVWPQISRIFSREALLQVSSQAGLPDKAFAADAVKLSLGFVRNGTYREVFRGRRQLFPLAVSVTILAQGSKIRRLTDCLMPWPFDRCNLLRGFVP
eukprot:1275502-Amphidinium_carterae.2